MSKKMNNDGRDSLDEFQSSIFDVSDGHQLANFIRKKKGLRDQPQKIFEDVRTDRQSFQIEIQTLDDDNAESTLQPNDPRPENEVDNEVQTMRSLRRLKSPGLCNMKIKVKRLSHTIGRRTLLKEFEKTLQESRFLPPTCSTPLTSGLRNLPPSPINAPTNEKTLSKSTETRQERSINLNNACTPITISDDSPSLETAPLNHSPQLNQLPTVSSNTEDIIRQLQQQNNFLLQLANSEEEVEPQGTGSKENTPASSPARPPVNANRTYATTNNEQRRTFTVHRDSAGGNILATDKSTNESVRQILMQKTPVKNVQINTKKLIVTPEQRKLLLCRFGRNSKTDSPQMEVAKTVQKSSRIPVGMSKATRNRSQLSCQVSENMETTRIIEQLQKCAPSNAPVIVIPVNQTFNQAPANTSHTTAQAQRDTQSPSSSEITSTTTITAPQSEPVAEPSTSNEALLPINSLRLADILTDDESSSSDDTPLRAQSDQRKKKQLPPQQEKVSIAQYKKQLSLRAMSPRRSSIHQVREIITQHELSRMTEDEILDLRKRNSHGELRKSLNMSQRESSMLDKQVELELLRRRIQERTSEDDVLQMEVLPPPPDEFCDNRQRWMLHRRASTISTDLVDETSADRISLSQEPPKSKQEHKSKRKTKRMSEQTKKYLEASEMVAKSNFLNLSKRKLYSKGNSDDSTSNDSSPETRNPFAEKSSRQTDERVPPSYHIATISTPRSRIPSTNVPTDQLQLPRACHLSNKSKETHEFIPKNSEMFKRPIGRPPKKLSTQQDTSTKSQPSSKTKKQKKGTTAPVDPDVIISTEPFPDGIHSELRRSKRERKPLTAYWSTTPKEYIPLYDVLRMLPPKKKKPIVTKIQKAKNLPIDNLVANTKKTQSKSVDKPKSKKQSRKKQQQEYESSSECPSHHGSTSSSIGVRRLTVDSSRSDNSERINESISENVPPAQLLTPFTEDVAESERHHTEPSKDRRQLSTTDDAPHPPNNAEPPKSKSKKKPSPSTTDCPSDVSAPSIQEVRLPSIAEDSVPELDQQVTINISELDQANRIRLSSELMPPPASCAVKKKSKLVLKHNKKNAFRKEYDESITDVSSVDVNKLFEQLKSSNMCVASSSSAQHVNCSGQVSLATQAKNHRAAVPKVNNLTVRLHRMKTKNVLSAGNDKVYDSGLSSDGVSSEHNDSGDILLNWLKQLLKNKNPSGSQQGVARFLQADGFHAANVDDLIFDEIDGIDYAFYNTEEQHSLGYIRFNQKAVKKKCTAKKYELNLIVLCGKVKITINGSMLGCKNGDIITVFKGSSYGIKNISNDSALIMVIRN